MEFEQIKTDYFKTIFLWCFTFLSVLFLLAQGDSSVYSEELTLDKPKVGNPAIPPSDVTKFDLLESISSLYNDLHVGPVGIKPSYTIDEVFDDNVYNAPKNEVDDYYTLHNFSLGLLLHANNLRANLDYNIDIYEYGHVQERDHVNQALEGTIEFEFANDFKFSFSDLIGTYVIPREVQRRAFGDIAELDIPIDDEGGPNIFVDRRDITINTAKFTIDFPDFIPTLDFEIHYENYDISYLRQTRDGSEFNSDAITATIEYSSPISPIKISSGFQYIVERYDTDKTRDRIREIIPFSIIWDVTPITKIYLDANYAISDYGNRSDLENFEGLSISLGCNWQITPVSSLELFVERDLKEQRRIDNNSYSDTGGGIIYNIKIDNFEANFSARYFHREFYESSGLSGTTEKIDGISASLNIMYNPEEWWFAEFAYNYDRLDNDFSLGDLTKNTVSLSMGLSF